MSAESHVLMPPGDRQASEPARYTLHRRACILLVSTSGALLVAGLATLRGAEDDLVAWTTAETGSPPALCPTCYAAA